MSVRVERKGPIFTVLLSRPERRNAVDGETAAALAEAFRRGNLLRGCGSEGHQRG
jgi:enoyl-CoA hydratase